MAALGFKSDGLKELWSRLRFVLLAIIIYRIGTHIPVPGIDPLKISSLFDQNQGTLLGLFNMFSGGALERMSIMALNVVPYITAAIVMNLLEATTPSLKKLFRQEGESGRRKRTAYVRLGTLVLAIFQSTGFAIALSSQGMAVTPGLGFIITAVISFVTGTMFLVWLGEQVNERGIGNGISLIIFASIVSGLPSAIGQSFEASRQGEISLILLLLIALFAILAIAFIVWIERAQRRITVNYARRAPNQMNTGQASHLPLKVNMAGVIPAIFASSLVLFPASMSSWFGQNDGFEWLQEVSLALSPGQPLYVVVFAVLIAYFCFFYTAIQFPAKDISDNLKRSGGFLPGIRPGDHTVDYIDNVMSRLTIWGSMYMIVICLAPQFLIVSANAPFLPRRNFTINCSSSGNGLHGSGTITPFIKPVSISDEESKP